MKKQALIIVDMQNDFVSPDGALSVPGATEIVDDISTFSDAFDLVIATRDWHPDDHQSFDCNGGGQWPIHCVAGTPGAQLVDGLLSSYHIIIDKGIDPITDGYSGFEGQVSSLGEHGGTLNDVLVIHDIATVHIVGVALDYCVKATALDAAAFGYGVIVHTSATRAVNPNALTVTVMELIDQGVTANPWKLGSIMGLFARRLL
jgi:nicotinamidase-related amidase